MLRVEENQLPNRDPGPTQERCTEPTQTPAPLSQATQQQHWLETYKSLIGLSIEGFKFAALVNGGAAVALLAYLGNLAANGTRVPSMRAPMRAFLLGLVFVGLSMVCAYLTQLQLLNETTDPRTSKGRHALWLWGAIGLFIGSLMAFTIGCWDAVQRF